MYGKEDTVCRVRGEFVALETVTFEWLQRKHTQISLKSQLDNLCYGGGPLLSELSELHCLSDQLNTDF